jgi:hypothetical protein
VSDSPLDEFDEIAKGAMETLREKAVRRYGNKMGMATLGHICIQYLVEKQRRVSFAFDMYEEGAPHLTTDLSLDDVELQIVQAGLQVLTLVGDDLPEDDGGFQGLVKGLLQKISDAVDAANQKTTPEQEEEIKEVAKRLEWKRVEEHLRSIGQQLGLGEDQIEETITQARIEAELFAAAEGDADTGFSAEPLQ